MNQFAARPYVLAETNWKTVKDTAYSIAALPWGATEAHNYHMPYATDNFQVDHVMAEAARLAWAAGAKTILLPCVPFGVNTGQADIKLCINMSPSTQFAVLKDVASVVLGAGINKLVIANGHGGNHFKQMIRELTLVYPDLFVCAIDWYRAAEASKFFDQPGDHAGELETSCIMNIRPELVRPLSEAGDGAAKAFRIAGFTEGWATAPRAWSQVTLDTGDGNPEAATPEKGEKFFAATSRNIGKFLIDLATTDAAQMYQ